jgi:hypothetical protein
MFLVKEYCPLDTYRGNHMTFLETIQYQEHTDKLAG